MTCPIGIWEKPCGTKPGAPARLTVEGERPYDGN